MYVVTLRGHNSFIVYIIMLIAKSESSITITTTKKFKYFNISLPKYFNIGIDYGCITSQIRQNNRGEKAKKTQQTRLNLCKTLNFIMLHYLRTVYTKQAKHYNIIHKPKRRSA